MTNTQKKFTRLGLILLGVALLLLFTPIFNGVYYGLMDPALIPSKGFEIALAVIVPVLFGVISFIVSTDFKCFTKEDALRQVEKQLQNGVISQDGYKKAITEIEMFELENKEMKAKLELEKAEFRNKIQNTKAESLKEFGVN